MPPVGFEPTISAGERPQTYALDRAATGTGTSYFTIYNLTKVWRALVNSVMNFGFYKMRGNSLLVEELLASQEGICFTELVRFDEAICQRCIYVLVYIGAP